MRTRLFSALAAAVVCVSAASAESTPTVPPGGFDKKPLLEALTKLAYEPNVTNADHGTCTVKVQRGTLTYHVSLVLSGDRDNIWISTPLCSYPTIGHAPAKVLRKMVELNSTIHPARYELRRDDRIHLVKRVGNHDLTPAKLRKEIESFGDLVDKQKPNWQQDALYRLAPTNTDAASAELNVLKGAWMIESYVALGKSVSGEDLEKAKVSIKIDGNKFIGIGNTQLNAAITLDPHRTVRAIDLTSAEGAAELGIYKLEGDRLTIHASPNGTERPADFSLPAGNKTTVLILSRMKN